MKAAMTTELIIHDPNRSAIVGLRDVKPGFGFLKEIWLLRSGIGDASKRFAVTDLDFC
jgi:hypothetical protein